MDSVELVKQICKERKIPISKLERDCGFANGYIRKLKEGKFPSDRLKIIADYLDLSVEYLMTGEPPEITRAIEAVDREVRKKAWEIALQNRSTGHYYINDEAREYAEFLFAHPEYKVLFDASRSVKKEDIDLVRQLIERFSEHHDD